mmetsp:Transcript_28636/g.42378  ORF Transcript_28636/g.42378 Transcript_28636/m.42378 type:complete len:222 (+) Transcript_28636:1843-2508(+)
MVMDTILLVVALGVVGDGWSLGLGILRGLPLPRLGAPVVVAVAGVRDVVGVPFLLVVLSVISFFTFSSDITTATPFRFEPLLIVAWLLPFVNNSPTNTLLRMLSREGCLGVATVDDPLEEVEDGRRRGEVAYICIISASRTLPEQPVLAELDSAYLRGIIPTFMNPFTIQQCCAITAATIHHETKKTALPYSSTMRRRRLDCVLPLSNSSEHNSWQQDSDK